MAMGTWSATAASTQIVAADEHREFLLIQHSNATQVALGFGVTAVATSGVQLYNKGDCALITGWMARLAVNAIGNGGTGSYQDGPVEFIPAPYVTP